jgi:hypothetical protein
MVVTSEQPARFQRSRFLKLFVCLTTLPVSVPNEYSYSYNKLLILHTVTYVQNIKKFRDHEKHQSQNFESCKFSPTLITKKRLFVVSYVYVRMYMSICMCILWGTK